MKLAATGAELGLMLDEAKGVGGTRHEKYYNEVDLWLVTVAAEGDRGRRGVTVTHGSERPGPACPSSGPPCPLAAD